MSPVKSLVAASALTLLMATSAFAVTVDNQSGGQIKVGVDYGTKEDVKTIGANKSVKLDCKEGCGVTGPWGFSWIAKGDDTIPTDGKSLIVVSETSATEGVGAGESGSDEPAPSTSE
jgi:hypothetical protein